MKTLISAALLCPALACAQATPPVSQMDLPHATLTIGMHHIDVQLAQTDWQRQVGLMHRRSMPEHEDMLFVFERPGVQCFWMKDTLIPLTAAFVADNLIQNIGMCFLILSALIPFLVCRPCAHSPA